MPTFSETARLEYLGFHQRPQADGVPGYSIEVFRCSCKFTIAFDADYIFNINTIEDRLTVKCPQCSALIIIGERL